MGLQEDRIKALKYEHPEFIPVGMGFLGKTWMTYREKLEDIVLRYPNVFPGYKKGQQNFDDVSGTYVAGDHTDAWGCVWSNVTTGMQAYVKGHPIPKREMVRTLKAPTVNDGLPHGFMYLRLTDLRGFEEMMMDFAEEPPELQMLLNIVLEYNVTQLKIMLKDRKSGEIMWFGDDLGMQHGLAMGAPKWRKYMKPCFTKLYSMVRAKGIYVYMHTDGQIFEIITDLVDCGVQVVNAQFRANGLDNLERVCKGKVCLDLDLDRQMFPFCKPKDIDAHVRECVERLGSPEGGLWFNAECAPDVPLENIEALAAALDKYRGFYR
jgi:uroporphyrinogen decarboxylase